MEAGDQWPAEIQAASAMIAEVVVKIAVGGIELGRWIGAREIDQPPGPIEDRQGISLWQVVPDLAEQIEGCPVGHQPVEVLGCRHLHLIHPVLHTIQRQLDHLDIPRGLGSQGGPDRADLLPVGLLGIAAQGDRRKRGRCNGGDDEARTDQPERVAPPPAAEEAGKPVKSDRPSRSHSRPPGKKHRRAFAAAGRESAGITPQTAASGV
ncbi:MAG TPA: hypothetical protein VMV33_11170 [Rhodocyclaceae bacterium]|nr:hypothetical protein [Rhodocyclaceae bacterium]